MKWCRVEFGQAVETTENDPEGRFHPDFEWLECPVEVEQGWLYEDGQFTATENG